MKKLIKTPPEGIIGYKGFNVNNFGTISCMDKIYKIGKIHILGEEAYENKDLVMCENGFHFCLLPIDVFDYYTFFNPNVEYCKVKAYDHIIKENENKDTKMATDKLEIIEKISIKDMILESVKILSSHNYRKYNKNYKLDQKSRYVNPNDSTPILISDKDLKILYNGSISEPNDKIHHITISTGRCSWALSDIKNSMAISYSKKLNESYSITTQKNSIAVSGSMAMCLDDNSIAVTDDRGLTKGKRSICVSNNKYSNLLSTGDNSIVCSTEPSYAYTYGENSVIVKTYNTLKDEKTRYLCKNGLISHAAGKNSVIVDLSENPRFKGAMGTVFVAAEYYDNKNEPNYGKIKKLHTTTVDGVNIRENIEYKFVNGHFFVYYL